ncbi:MAG: helix-turn-helix transcriptional regulator [Sulfurimonas sp.]|jgi:transcriptional regulator with XRE-family HTH domain
MTELKQLGHFVKHLRENKKESQIEIAKRLGTNRSVIAHFEQGERVPKPAMLAIICNDLKVPEIFWIHLIDPNNNYRIEFETILSELVGSQVSLESLSSIEHEEAKKHMNLLFNQNGNEEQVFDNFNRYLIFYGVKKISKVFFKYYLFDKNAFTNMEHFNTAVQTYQKDAIRVFSTFALAYGELNKDKQSFNDFLKQLETNDLSPYFGRNKWNSIITIEDKLLPYLGYIAAGKVAEEEKERKRLIDFLKDIVNKLGTRKVSQHTLQAQYDKKTLNKMDTLLRKFESKIEHGFLSSLFDVDIGLIEAEISNLAPKAKADLIVMKDTQDKAFANLTNYLTADYMDLYIATSMRNDGDFISVNNFVNSLMQHSKIEKLNLRYFNPTQSWIDDRIAKGLIEALMLKRASITIYMAQKSDTFGKDSEASVALGQGKPVIVYVPKLTISEINLDSSELARMNEAELRKYIGEDEDYEEYDYRALLSEAVKNHLDKASDDIIIASVIQYWAEFDLESEIVRIKEDHVISEYRVFLNEIKNNEEITPISKELIEYIKIILLSVTINYEIRANIFKEVHPLALQVILSSGVLNGILVARSLESCADLLQSLLINKMDLELKSDENNYKLVEKSTGSVIRVISKNILLSYSFEQFYQYGKAE